EVQFLSAQTFRGFRQAQSVDLTLLNTVNFLLTIIQGSSSLDIGLSGRSLSQITVTIHHRCPSQNSSMLFTPRSITGPCSEYLLSYVLRTLAMLPNFSVLRCISPS